MPNAQELENIKIALNNAKTRILSIHNYFMNIHRLLDACTPEEFKEYKNAYWYGPLLPMIEAGLLVWDVPDHATQKSDTTNLIRTYVNFVDMLTLKATDDPQKTLVKAYLYILIKHNEAILQLAPLKEEFVKQLNKFPNLRQIVNNKMRDVVDRFFEFRVPYLAIQESALKIMEKVIPNEIFSELNEILIGTFGYEPDQARKEKAVEKVIDQIEKIDERFKNIRNDYAKLIKELDALGVPRDAVRDEFDRLAAEFASHDAPKGTVSDEEFYEANSEQIKKFQTFEGAFEMIYQIIINTHKFREYNRLLRQKLAEAKAAHKSAAPKQQTTNAVTDTPKSPEPSVELEQERLRLEKLRLEEDEAQRAREKQRELEIAEANRIAAEVRAARRAEAAVTAQPVGAKFTPRFDADSEQSEYVKPAASAMFAMPKLGAEAQRILEAVFAGEHDLLTLHNLETLMVALAGKDSVQFKKGSGVIFRLNKNDIVIFGAIDDGLQALDAEIKTKFGMHNKHGKAKGNKIWGCYIRELRDFLIQAGVQNPNLPHTKPSIAPSPS
jgi:hypothetical protein